MSTERPGSSLHAHKAQWLVALGVSCVFSALGLLRYKTFHNETFDLAFYARMVWGAGHLDFYNPMVGASLWGLHLSWVIIPLGLLGRALPVIPLMLVSQALCVSLAAVPLARIASRHISSRAAPWIALSIYYLHPAIGSLATYEFHPSALSLLPLCLALDAFDQAKLRAGVVHCTLALACREDIALVTALMGASLALQHSPRARTYGLSLFVLSILYFSLYLFVIAPSFLPREGSLQLHYGHLGASPGAIVSTLFSHPIDTLRELATPVKLRYIPRLLVTTGFVSLLAPRWLVPALAPLGINLLSQFPTAVQVHSHYAALSVPFFVASALHALGRLEPRPRALLSLIALLGGMHMQHRAGVLPVLGRRFDLSAFKTHRYQSELEATLRDIPLGASVTAPDFMLSHLSQRVRVFRYPSPPRRIDYRIFTTEYRARFEGTEEVFRNIEERALRNALFWNRYGITSVHGPFLIEKLSQPERAFARGRYLEFSPIPGVHAAHADIGPSMAVAGFGLFPGRDSQHTRLVLLLVAKTRWPFDLGLQVGYGPMHPHLDRQDPRTIFSFLPFDGLLMPTELRVNEVARTEVQLPASRQDLLAHGLYFGPRRIDSSRLDAHSPHWTALRPEAPRGPSSPPR